MIAPLFFIMSLPVGFDTVGLVNEFFAIGAVIMPLAFLVSAGFLLMRVLKKVRG